VVCEKQINRGKTEQNLDGDEAMGGGDPLFRAAHLGLEQWNNMPDGSRIRCSCDEDQTDIERDSVYSKVIPFLFNFMAMHLTARQFEIVRMYHLDYRLTQDAIGQVLGIAQPTVNQHLNGKRRDGKHVGGAYRRIRREICSVSNSDDLSADDRRILRFLMSLDRSDTPFKKRRRLSWSLQ
jgi:DNA-binding CsgD family transcriptional regulator